MMRPKQLARICKRAAGEKTFSTDNIQVLILQEEQTQVVAYRGTEFKISGDSIKDIFTNLISFPTVTLECGKVHKGTYKAAKASIAELKQYLDKTKPVCLTGHSLGGALAIIAGQLLKKSGYNVELVVTFGAPKIVTESSTGFYSNLLISQYANYGDLVPDYFGNLWKYVHLHVIYLGSPNVKKCWIDHDIDVYIKNL